MSQRVLSKTLFHGTSKKNAAAIQESGLKLVEGVNPYRWPMLTDSREQAAAYTKGQEEPSVVEFSVPEKLLGPALPHNVYGHTANAYGSRDQIPAEYVRGIHAVK